MPTVEYRVIDTMYTTPSNPDEQWSMEAFKESILNRLLVLDANLAQGHQSFLTIQNAGGSVGWNINALKVTDVWILNSLANLLEKQSVK
jgi:hypothetical protein